MRTQDAKARQSDLLHVHTDLSASETRDISGALNILLADMFVQYLKTKNFHRRCQVRNFVAFIAPDARRILPSAICDAADVTSSEAVIGCGDAAQPHLIGPSRSIGEAPCVLFWP
jgi:hypothetical protein